ncbi:MAG: TetR/AcrR family transcriptional regulator [Erysipelotrichaceae bacterium]|nr:TetR/AcrR family transcriptional regulator [Erysipelotrichaceae bacterium]
MKEKVSFAQRQLTESLLKLIKKKRINEITVSELCNKAQLSRLSFYRNYDSIEEILRRHLSNITGDFLNKTSVNYRITPKEQFITELFSHLLNHRSVIELLFSNNLSYLVKEEFDEAFSRSAEKYDDIYRCYVASGAYFNLFYYWFINGCKESPQTLSDLMNGFLV